LFALFGCYESYPPPPGSDLAILVVDALVNSSEGSATVILSTSIPLSSSDSLASVNDAVVILMDDGNNQTSLAFDGSGHYSVTGLAIHSDANYQLIITTPDGKKYQSDFVPSIATPPIDSVTWSIERDQLNIQVNTHDDTKSSTYYRWRFTETWEYSARWQSAWKVQGDSIMPRRRDEAISQCWRTQPGFNINIYSTGYLSRDIASKFKLLSIDANSIRLSYKYSIEVQQQTLTREAYHYWDNVKKTTESLGTLFDPLPASVKGNIHCVSNSNEPVIGYFSVGSVAKERIFITSAELGQFVTFRYPYCEIKQVDPELITHAAKTNNILYPIYEETRLIGWAVASPLCSDCRVFGGGSTTKPPFWND